LPNRGR